ncbi:hypothetical protein [Galbibacter pacificus]|uniref:Uncharacterized protein n=1 Tax=Galbibacter pacificus TaxID=2996052 RepID=A0ABT6FNT0_9FLAO|nr:hypothetical protein [Galbibacter pacificus]MDG3581440.1 hypothetical protein [Galbibacter pacificus]MDG3584918.1 hypothetical protein [Galbibacter pacificus]
MTNITMNNLGEINQNRKIRILDSITLINSFLKDDRIKDMGVSCLMFNILKRTNQDKSKFENKYFYWESNQTILGFCQVTHHIKTKKTIINFRRFKENSISEIELFSILRENIKSIFESYVIDRIIFIDDENSSEYISELFLKNFNPYPIGYVHLNEGKYVLTKNKFLGEKEQFYKSDYLNYIGK